MSVTDLLPAVADLAAEAGPQEHAEAAGLAYADVTEPGITRVRRGRGWSFHAPDGTTLAGEERERCLALAIPPAWTDVWICPDTDGHVQATGRDDRDRRQYLYHPRWRELRDATKFHRMASFGAVLPTIRSEVDRALRRRTMHRERVAALVVALLDATVLRVGNDSYVEANGSHGLTTLRCDHVEVDGTTIRFAFPAKGGQERELELRDRRLARQVLRCHELPGQRLFAWLDPDGDPDDPSAWRACTSGDVNEWLAEAAGCRVTAKDFRTWGASTLAAEVLAPLELPSTPREADREVLAMYDLVAERLGNTRAVARDSYVDPRVPEAWREGRLATAFDRHEDRRDGLDPAERAFLRLVS